MSSSSAFQRTIEILERAHRLSLILLVGPSNRANEAKEQLDKLLPPHLHARSYHIDRQGPDILSFAESLADRFPIIFVHGFEKIDLERREDIEIRLNLLRDAFAQHHLGLIFWLPKDTLESFLQHCPDLFAWRSLLSEVDGTELVLSPILATRREYLSHMLREARLPDVVVEIRVRAMDGPSLPIGFQEWAMKTRLGVVIGSAGSGKTTALQVLAHRLADHAYDDTTQPVPVLLHGRAFSSAPRFSRSRIWTCGVDLGLPPDVLSMLAESGQLLVLLDGLDEAALAARQPLLDWIGDLANRYPRLRMIIATRAGRSSSLAALSRSWETVYVQGLNEEQIDEFIRGYLISAGVELPEAELRRLGAFIEGSEIMRHPLFIPMLLARYLRTGRLPFDDQRHPTLDRVQLLSEIVDRQLMDSDEVDHHHSGIGRARRADLLSDKEVRRALQSMALAAMIAGTSRIPRERVLSLFPGFSDQFSSETVRENAEYLLISRTGLVQAEPGGLAFVHVGIQAYLAAEGLVEHDPGRGLGVLVAHLPDNRWREVVAYVVALLELRYSAGMKLLDALAAHALGMPGANQRAASFATLLGSALGAGVWSDTLASLLQAARLMIEDSSDATYSLEPVVDQAMSLHGKVG